MFRCSDIYLLPEAPLGSFCILGIPAPGVNFANDANADLFGAIYKERSVDQAKELNGGRWPMLRLGCALQFA